jgi:hypothetical protein
LTRLGCAILLVVSLASCGGDGSIEDQCAGAGDTITASRPVVTVASDREGCSFTAGEQRALADGSTIRVERGEGSNGLATLVFADIGVCNLLQLEPDKPAIITTRFEGSLFRQRRGNTRCTLRGRVRAICRNAIVELSGQVTQARIGCDPDPVLSVAPYRGDVTVTLRSGDEYALGAGQELKVYPEPTDSVPAPEVASAEFTMMDVATFERQAGMMDVAFKPLTPTPTPTVTPTLGPPINTSPPAVGWQTSGETLVVTSYGAWEPPADSYSVTWESACTPDGSTCRPTGATGETYSPIYNQDCNFVRAVVTATNGAGSAVAASPPFSIPCVD